MTKSKPGGALAIATPKKKVETEQTEAEAQMFLLMPLNGFSQIKSLRCLNALTAPKERQIRQLRLPLILITLFRRAVSFSDDQTVYGTFCRRKVSHNPRALIVFSFLNTLEWHWALAADPNDDRVSFCALSRFGLWVILLIDSLCSLRFPQRIGLRWFNLQIGGCLPLQWKWLLCLRFDCHGWTGLRPEMV